METEDTIVELEKLVDILCKEDSEEHCDHVADRLMDISHTIHKQGGEQMQQFVKEKGARLEQCAIMMWNVAVSKKTGNAIGDLLNAKLRHLASNLAFTSGLPAENFSVQKRHVMMASKAAGAWLDCSHYSMAKQCLTLALEGLEKLKKYVQVPNPPNQDGERGAWLTEKRKEVDREAFKIFCFKAKATVGQEQHKAAMEWIERAKPLLATLTTEVSLLSKLCYNFGCDAVKAQTPEAAVDWLRESFELGKECHDIDCKTQARTLRLLANAYLDWDSAQYSQKALNAVCLANAEHSHPFGLHLKVKILLLGDIVDNKLLQAAVEECILHNDLTMDLAVETVKLLATHDMNELAQTACRRLSSRFAAAPTLGKLLVLQLQLLTKNKKMQQAKNLVEETITGRSCVLDEAILRQLHTLLWEQAAAAYEMDDFTESLVWYNYSLSLLAENADMEKVNIAKLQRNRVSCYINLQQFQKADEAMKEAEKYDPSNLYTYYLLFKVAIHKGQDEEAVSAIEKLGAAASTSADSQSETVATQEEVHSLISLAAQLAFERSNRPVAISALESLIRCSTDPQQILTCFRCLTRLRLTLSEDSSDPVAEATAVATYVEAVLAQLKEIAEKEVISATEEEMVKNEATWFLKVAWNLAIEHSSISKITHQFFTLCGKTCALLSSDDGNIGRHKTCLGMAAAASLQRARETPAGEEKEAILQQVLVDVSECRTLCSLTQGSDQGDGVSRDKTLSMLLLYEFEALAKLGRTAELESLVRKLLASPHHDVKVLETLAALAMEPPAHYKQLSKKLFQAALDTHLKSENLVPEKCSKSLHNLVRLCLGEGCSADTAGREQAWKHYQTALRILESKQKDAFPEMEVLWLMTKAWNTGIYAFSSGQYNLADSWCCLGMELMGHLSGLKNNYEEKMTSLFGEIKLKITSAKAKDCLEE